jgi:hypothetical protein
VNGDPADHAGKFDGRQAYPEYLRSQPMNVALGLLQANNVPLWNERLFGTAKHAPFPDKLILLNNDPGPALLGIAEPDRQCFDFSVDVSKNQGGGPNQNRVGVVFGWRRSPPAGVFPRHFVVELDDEPSEKNPIGQVKLGTGWLARAKGKENGDLNFEWYRPLKGGKGVIPLSKGGAFHTIEVRVRRDTATVVVNQRELQVISLAWLRESDESAAANLDPRGTVGLWAMNGAGRFRKASITLIADLP